MAQQDQNSLGAMMAAQGELSSLNAARAQNSQAEQAFLQQQQAANAVMMQAAQIGTSGGLGQQVGAMNPQTQALLAQYGINGVAPQPGKTTSINKTTQSGGNIKIENNTTTNNDIKIVNPPSQGGGDGGNQAKFQTWLSNSFAKQNQEYEVQRRAFAKRDRDLEKQSNKMMRELEKSTSTLGEKLNPKTWAIEQTSQLKTVMTVLLLTVGPTLVKPIVDAFQSIFGGGDRNNDPIFIKNLKESLGIEEGKTLIGGITELVSNQIAIWQDKLEVKFQERAKLVKTLEKPKKSIVWDTDGWMSYIGNVMTTIFGGVEGAKKSTMNEHKDEIIEGLSSGRSSAGSGDRTYEDIRTNGGSYFSTDSSLTLNTNVGDVIDKSSGKIKQGAGIEAQARIAARVTQIITSKSGELNTGELSNIMSSLAMEAEESGMINIGKLPEAMAFIQSLKGDWDELIKTGHLKEITEKIIYFYTVKPTEPSTTISPTTGVSVPVPGTPGIVGFRSVDLKSNETTEKDLVQKGFKDEIISSYYLTVEGLKMLQDNLKEKYGLSNLEFSDSSSTFTAFDALQIETRQNLHPEITSYYNTETDAELKEKLNNLEGIERETAKQIERIDARDGAVKRYKEAQDERRWGKEHSGDVVVTSEFNESRDGYHHGGIDIDLEKGENVYSTGDGVITIGEDDRSGKYVKVLHPDNTETFYCHLDKNDYFKTGDSVSEGDIIGLGGNTGHCISSGNGDGSHLHYEVRKLQEDGTYKKINPRDTLQYSYIKTLIPRLDTENSKDIKSEYDISALELKETPKIEEIFETVKGEDGKEKKVLTGLKENIGAFEIQYDPSRASMQPGSKPSEHISSILLNGTLVDKNSQEYKQLLEKIDEMHSAQAYPGIYSISDKQMIKYTDIKSGDSFLSEWIDLGEFSWTPEELGAMVAIASYQITTDYNNRAWFKYTINKTGQLLQVCIDGMSLDTPNLNTATNTYFKTGNIIRSWAGFSEDAYNIFYPGKVPTNIGDYNPAFFSMGVTMPKAALERLNSNLRTNNSYAQEHTRFYSVTQSGDHILTSFGETMVQQGFAEVGVNGKWGGLTESGKFMYDWTNTQKTWNSPLISGNYDYVQNGVVGGSGRRELLGNGQLNRLVSENQAIAELAGVAKTLGKDIIVIGKDVISSAKTEYFEGRGMHWKVADMTPTEVKTEETPPISTLTTADLEWLKGLMSQQIVTDNSSNSTVTNIFMTKTSANSGVSD